MSKSDCSETSSEGREGRVPGPPSGNELGVDTEREGGWLQSRSETWACGLLEEVGDVGSRSAVSVGKSGLGCGHKQPSNSRGRKQQRLISRSPVKFTEVDW